VRAFFYEKERERWEMCFLEGSLGENKIKNGKDDSYVK